MLINIAHVIEHANSQFYRKYPVLEKPTNDGKYINKRDRLFMHYFLMWEKKKFDLPREQVL